MLTTLKPKEPKVVVKEFQVEIKLLQFTQVVPEFCESLIITLK